MTTVSKSVISVKVSEESNYTEQCHQRMALDQGFVRHQLAKHHTWIIHWRSKPTLGGQQDAALDRFYKMSLVNQTRDKDGQSIPVPETEGNGRNIRKILGFFA